jgi:hypothetical protein
MLKRSNARSAPLPSSIEFEAKDGRQGEPTRQHGDEDNQLIDRLRSSASLQSRRTSARAMNLRRARERRGHPSIHSSPSLVPRPLMTMSTSSGEQRSYAERERVKLNTSTSAARRLPALRNSGTERTQRNCVCTQLRYATARRIIVPRQSMIPSLPSSGGIRQTKAPP